MNYKIIFLGPPGSGKDTQANLLATHLQIPKISIGELLRNEVQQNTDLGKEIAPYLEHGEIPPGNIGTRVFKEAFDRGELNGGYILVGFPRSADALERYLAIDQPTHVIVLNLERDIALSRMHARDRADDQDEKQLIARCDRFNKMEEPVINKLREKNIAPILTIDASHDIASVQKEILKGFN